MGVQNLVWIINATTRSGIFVKFTGEFKIVAIGEVEFETSACEITLPAGAECAIGVTLDNTKRDDDGTEQEEPGIGVDKGAQVTLGEGVH